MKTLLYLLFLVLPLWVYSQEGSSVVLHNFRLQEGGSIILGSKSISFKKVLSDSRCPTGVSCIWPGEAKVMMEVRKNGKISQEKIVEINAGAGIPETLFLGDSYKIAAMELLPYPAVPPKDQRPEYLLVLKVEENF